MEGLIIAVFGGLAMFIVGTVYGATRINHPKILIYSLLISVGGLVTFAIAGNVARILTEKNSDKLGSYGEMLGVLLFCGFLCVPLGAGAIIAGSIRLIVKDQNLSRPKVSQ